MATTGDLCAPGRLLLHQYVLQQQCADLCDWSQTGLGQPELHGETLSPNVSTTKKKEGQQKQQIRDWKRWERGRWEETEGFCTASRRPTAPPAGVLIIAHQIPRTPSFLWLTICLRNNLDEQRFILTSSFRDFSPRSLWTLSEAKYHGRIHTSQRET